MSSAVDRLLDADATEQARAIHDGEVSAAELAEGALGRVAARNPAVGAVIHVDADRAHRRIEELDGTGPFCGVPILYKDLGSCEAGMPLTWGNEALRRVGHTAAKDGPLAARLRPLGFVPLGKTNTCEIGIQPTTQPLAYGPTRNPWDVRLAAGGSSGGSAAAVASGMVAIAHGTDAAGSLRVPATWCGVTALKVSRGALPMGEEIDRNRTEFLLARSVRDLRTVFPLVAGSAAEDLYGFPAAVGGTERAVAGLRVGVQLSLPGIDVDAEVAAAVAAAARALEMLGCEITPVELPLAAPGSAAAGLVYTRSLLRSNLSDLERMVGHPLEDDEVEPYSRALAFDGDAPTGAALFDAMKTLQRTAVMIVRAWEAAGLDLLLTPGVPTLPATIEELTPPADDPLAVRSTFARIWSFARPFNQTGQPAMAMPAAWSAGGLPIGIQIVAARGAEATLLAAAIELERELALERRIAAAGDDG